MCLLRPSKNLLTVRRPETLSRFDFFVPECLGFVGHDRALAARRGDGSVASALRNENPGDDVPATLREAVARFERTLIGQAVRSHNGRMDAVAEALGIGRRTLNEKIVKLGLDKTEWVE